MNIGDLILFKGNGVFSKLIMAHPKAEYSHVGMYVEYDGKPCVFESTSIGSMDDVINHEIIKGVQLTPYVQRVASYDGGVYVMPISGKRTQQALKDLDDFIIDNYAKPYETSNWELANAQLDFMPWHANKEDDSSLFCSETMIYTLRVMGFILDDGTPANEYTPTDCALNLPYAPGYSPDNVIQIKPS